MSDETEKALLDWENDDDEHCPSNDLHIHFEEFGRWNWVDIAEEARRIHNLMFNDHVEDGSPVDGLWNAVAAQAAHGAYCSVAAALGVDAKSLFYVIASWYENQDAPPPPVTADKLIELCKEKKMELDTEKMELDTDDCKTKGFEFPISERTVLEMLAGYPNPNPHPSKNRK
jgi:hypothetical protein